MLDTFKEKNESYEEMQEEISLLTTNYKQLQNKILENSPLHKELIPVSYTHLQTAGRTYPDRRSRQPEELGRNLAQTQQDRKDTDGETSTQYGPCPQQYTKKRRFTEHIVRSTV